MAWTGFTDDQLNALKSQASHDGEKTTRTGRPPGQHSKRGRGRGGNIRGRGRQTTSQQMKQESISEDQMLSRPKQQRGPRGKPSAATTAEQSMWSDLNEPSQQRPPPARRKTTAQQDLEEDGEKDGKEDCEVKHDAASNDSKEEKEGEKVKILDEGEGQEREITKLEEFQKKQKQMEEENAKKKSLLARAIADRKKKTQAETKRLLYIQKELAKIETLLSNDVSILRDKIEEASRDFNDAQRRYQKAEAEFVAAKIHLHKSSEMKEALTEHLCTIIHENELRKAKKLEELVSKLDVENLDDFDIPEETPPTSPDPKTIPPQPEGTENPSKNSGTIQISSSNSGSKSMEVGDSTAHTGESSEKLDSISEQSSASTPSIEKEQTVKALPTENIRTNVDEADVKVKNITTLSDQKNENSVTENEIAPANDQPEAEQHVELNQT